MRPPIIISASHSPPQYPNFISAFMKTTYSCHVTLESSNFLPDTFFYGFLELSVLIPGAAVFHVLHLYNEGPQNKILSPFLLTVFWNQPDRRSTVASGRFYHLGFRCQRMPECPQSWRKPTLEAVFPPRHLE